VEDLGAAGLEARALARGHDGNSEGGGFHTGLWSHGRLAMA
jgi:hypothetical protein